MKLDAKGWSEFILHLREEMIKSLGDKNYFQREYFEDFFATLEYCGMNIGLNSVKIQVQHDLEMEAKYGGVDTE